MAVDGEDDKLGEEAKLEYDKKLREESKQAVMAIPNEDMPLESAAKCLPMAARRLHGCTNCEWKLHGLCPYGLDNSNRGRKALAKGICPERKEWLLSFSLSYRERPTFAQWQRDFNRVQAQIVLHKDYTGLILIEEKLQKLKAEDAKVTEINKVKAEQAFLRKQWLDLWKELARVDESQLNREQPKKVEHSFDNKIPLSEIHRIMRENIGVGPIDVDFEEVDETKQEEKKDESH